MLSIRNLHGRIQSSPGAHHGSQEGDASMRREKGPIHAYRLRGIFPAIGLLFPPVGPLDGIEDGP
jgi:hypothetical protein